MSNGGNPYNYWSHYGRALGAGRKPESKDDSPRVMSKPDQCVCKMTAMGLVYEVMCGFEDHSETARKLRAKKPTDR